VNRNGRWRRHRTPEPRHVQIVTAILAGVGLTESDLGCPPDWPLGHGAARDWIAAGGTMTRVRMNCSGKHAAMLATCVHQGWSTADYLRPDHPLQQAVRATVEDLTGQSAAAVGVDGCGAPVFAISLRGLARALSRISSAPSGAEHDVATAMRAYPELVAGTGRSATRLMASIPGLLAKDGAEGVYVAALADGSVVATKIDDGALRAAEQATVAGLGTLLGPLEGLSDLADEPVLGGGVPVDEIRFTADLAQAR
jgi:L-asparaginase II